MMVAVAAMFTFAACGGDEPAPQPQKPAEKTQLEAPVVTVKDVTETGFTIEWTAVANATEYAIYLNKDNKPTTTATSYTFTDLKAGTYKPRVMALGGENYENSEYSAVVEVVVVGPSSIDWFTQTLSLAEVNEEKGTGPYNAVTMLWKGTGVTEAVYGIFSADYFAESATEKDILAEMKTAADAEWIADINSAEGLQLTCPGLDGGVEYAFYVYVTNDKGVSFMEKDVIATEEAQPSAATEKWLGAWTVNTTKAVSFDQNANISEIDQEETFTVTVYPSLNSPNEVIIDGLSVLGADQGVVTYGEVSEDTLWILSGVLVNTTADGIGNYWIGWYTLGQDFFPSIDGYPSAVVTLAADGNAATSTNVIPMYDQAGNPVNLTCNCNDVFGVSSKGEIYFYVENFPAVYRTGAMTWTKAAAAPATSSVAPKAAFGNMLKSSVVIAK